MALPYEGGVPQVAPQTNTPGGGQNIRVSESSFGADLGRGLEQLGQAGMAAARFYGQVAVDDQINDVMRQSDIIRKGDPQKMTVGPDGQPVPDVGFMGMKGADAMRAWPGTVKRLDDVIAGARKNLTTAEQQHQFDSATRRMRSFWYEQIGSHANREFTTWGTNVQRTTAKGAADRIAADPNNLEQVAANSAELIGARVREAQIQSGNDPVAVREAEGRGKQEALGVWLDAVGADNPREAMRILNQPGNRAIAGTKYDELHSKFRTRAGQQEGIEIADDVSGHRSPGAVPTAGMPASFVGAIKRSEGFSPVAKWDQKQFSYGYGTKATKEGERITKEEADKQFGAEIEKASRIVDAVNPNLDAGTRAALTSLTYNAGADWVKAGLGDAIRAGDMAKAKSLFLQYNMAGGQRNEGLAARRYREAQWFGQGDAPGGGVPTMDKQRAYEQVLDRTKDDPIAQSAAIGRLNQIYSVYRSQDVARTAAFDMRQKDSIAEASQTGVAANPLTEQEFVDRMGVETGMLAYRDYYNTLLSAADRKAITTMTPEQQQQAIDKALPAAGSQGYEDALRRRDSLIKAVQENHTLRREDPAKSVETEPAVMAAMSAAKPDKPETMQALAAVRLAAQEAIGIPADGRAPITKQEALDLTVPLRRMLPGQERRVLTELGQQFQKLYGPYADEAFTYSIRANKVSAETGQSAASVMRKLGLGQPVGREEAVIADQRTELDAASQAVSGTPRPASERRGANPGRMMAREARGEGQSAPAATPAPAQAQPAGAPKAGGDKAATKPLPPTEDIMALRRKPSLAVRFNEKYGPGAAEKILKDYPVGIGQQ